MCVEAVLITSRVIIKVPETGLICFFPQENLKNQGKVLPQNLLKNSSDYQRDFKHQSRANR